MASNGLDSSLAPASDSSFPLRDDIVQFSHQMVASSRNRYRNKNNLSDHSRHNSTSINPPITQDSTRNSRPFANASPASDDLLLMLEGTNRIGTAQRKKNSFTTHAERRKQLTSKDGMEFVKSMQLQKMQKIRPRLSSTAFQLKRADSESLREKKIANIFGPGSQEKSVVESIERKHHKGGRIKESGIEEWLNEALTEATSNIELNQGVEKAAIKAYCIDRSSLISKGIHPDNISRLYRCLFVYSIGFNNQLRQISNHSMELVKSIWKAFAVLLEYCSKGQYQSMIGDIERDKAEKLQGMKGEIERRQKVIEDSDKRYEEKQTKVMRELREAQDKASDLTEQRKVILQDFYEAEQSFNQEIMLRIKYENRINEIHGVFEELRQKHESLLENHREAMRKLEDRTKIVHQLEADLAKTKSDLEDKTREASTLSKQNQLYKISLLDCEKKLSFANSEYLSNKSFYENSASVVHELEMKIKNQAKGLDNARSIQKSLREALALKSRECEQGIRENSGLNKKNFEQAEAINGFIQQLREKGHGQNQIRAKYLIEVRKNEQKYNSILELKKQILVLEENYRLVETDLEGEREQTEILRGDLQKIQVSIKEMKNAHTQLQRLLDEAQDQAGLLKQSLKDKQEKAEADEVIMEELNKKVTEMQAVVRFKESQIGILEQKLASESEILNKKISNLQEQNDAMSEKVGRFEAERNDLVSQIEQNRQRYETIFQDYKNERFERTNLDLRYQQSLTVLEEENLHIKHLNIEISLMKEDISELERKLKRQEFIFHEKETVYIKDAAFWKRNYQQTALEVKNRRMHVHPMFHEDVCSNYARLHQLFESVSQDNQQLKKKLQKVQIDKTRLEQESKIVVRKSKDQEDTNWKEQIAKRDNQMKFQLEKFQYQQKLLNQAETRREKAQKEKQMASEQLMVKETELMEKIKERNIQLQEISKRYQHKYQECEEAAKLAADLNEKAKFLEKEIQILSSGNKKSHVETKKKTNIELPASHQNYHSAAADQIQDIDNRASEEEAEGDYMASKEMNETGKESWGPEGERSSSKCLDKEEEPKKRENIRKKIHGAYMYYHK